MRFILVVLVQILHFVQGKSDPEGNMYLREKNHSNNRRDHLVTKSMSLPQKYPGNNKKYYLVEVAKNMANESGKEPGTCRDVCSEVNNIENCEAMCYSDRPGENFVKVYVGVVMPRIAPSAVYAFSLCQDRKCVNNGTVSTFGDAGVHTRLRPGEIVDNEKFHIVEVDVTDVMVKEGWSFKKSLEAKMINKVMKNLPEPVVIIKTFGKGRKLAESKLKYSSNEKQERYGNLLDKYSS